MRIEQRIGRIDRAEVVILPEILHGRGAGRSRSPTTWIEIGRFKRPQASVAYVEVMNQ
jgi:hypothetical protein